MNLILGCPRPSIRRGLPRSFPRQPVAQKSNLGWVIYSSSGVLPNTSTSVAFPFSSPLQTMNSTFYSTNFGSRGKLHPHLSSYSRRRRLNARRTLSTHTRVYHQADTSSAYHFVRQHPLLAVLARLQSVHSVECSNDSHPIKLKQLHSDFLQEYEILGHMVRASETA